MGCIEGNAARFPEKDDVEEGFVVSVVLDLVFGFESFGNITRDSDCDGDIDARPASDFCGLSGSFAEPGIPSLSRRDFILELPGAKFGCWTPFVPEISPALFIPYPGGKACKYWELCQL